VFAVAPSLSYRLTKFARRNWIALGTVGLFAAMLISGTLISTWQALRATRHAQESRRQAQIAARATERANLYLDQSRHEEGRAWLERAEGYVTEKKYFQAKLMAAQAIGFEGFGRERGPASVITNLPLLLRRDSPEHRSAEQLITSQPDYPLVWQS